MMKREFREIERVAVERCPPGDTPSTWAPGDFILTRGDALLSRLIRVGERIRIHGDDRRFAWCNHAALIVSDDGDIAEALARGVVRRNISAYAEKDYLLVRTGATPADAAEVVAFAEWVLGGPGSSRRYGFFTIASIVLTVLTGSKFTFFIDGTYICSGFVARSQERTGAIFNLDPVHITPADLAKYYRAVPTATAEPGPAGVAT